MAVKKSYQTREVASDGRLIQGDINNATAIAS